MTNREQARQAAESILDKPRQELKAKRDKRARLASAERRRRESPIIPAGFAAITVVIALDFLDPVIAVVLGTLVGGLYGWAARKSS